MPGSPDDILFDAAVNDRTGEFFDRFDKSLDNAATKAANKFAQVDKGVKGTGVGMSALAGIVGGAVGGAVALAGQKVLELLDKFSMVVSQAGELRARADTLAVTLDIVGKNAGYSKTQMAGFEESLRKTGISIIATRQTLAQMVQAEMDLTKSSEIARVAQDAAVIAGVNSSESFQRIIHAATTLQPEILRSLGLVVNMQQELQKYAKETGKTAQQISIQEKQQLMLNATIKAGAKIAGSYEAAMTTVGKKQQSLIRIQEDFMVALGAVLQPAKGVFIDAQTEALKKLTKFLEENEDKLIEFGESFAFVFGEVLKLLEQVLEILIKMPDYIKTAGMDIAALLADIFGEGWSEEEIKKRGDNIGIYFKQAASIIIGFYKTVFQSYMFMLDKMVEGISSVMSFVSGDISFDELVDKMKSSYEELADYIIGTSTRFAENVKEVSEWGTAADKAGDAAKGAAPDVKDLGEAAEDSADAFNKANEKLQEFYYSMQQDIAQMALERTRQNIEDALQEAWRLEDLAKKHADNVAAIMEGASESQQEAMKSHAEARIQIERDYQRRIRGIKQDFEYEAEELSRARDAIGLLRLMRQTDRELKEAKEARNDARQDSDVSYQKQQQDIDKRRQKALQDLAIQEAKEEESYQQSLDRQKALQEMHDRWAKEDRQRKYAEQLAALIRQFQSMGNITSTQLDTLFSYWKTYFGNLIILAQQSAAEVEKYSAPGTETTTTTTTTSPAATQKVVGQGGLVSQLLANPSMVSPYSVPRIPAVSTVNSNESRSLDIKVSGEALDPYIQRVLVAAIMEIERNRGLRPKYAV